MTGISDRDIRSGLIASAGPVSAGRVGAQGVDSGTRKAIARKPPLMFALGAVMVATTGVTILLDDFVSGPLAPFQAGFFLGRLIVWRSPRWLQSCSIC